MSLVLGNQKAVSDDLETMQCITCREALSARLDGEDPGVPAEEVDAHLATCPDCAEWSRTAVALSGIVRHAPRDGVALDPALLASLTSPPDPERRRGLLSVFEWRVALCMVAVAQLVVSWPGVLLHDGHASVHFAHELTAWDLGLAAGFLVAVLWPARAWGMLPLASILVGAMVGTSLLDALSGNALLGREFVHLLEVAGLVCLWALARRVPRPSVVVRLA
jgi:predicted anti-sigma-YlaC factor YlaD